MSLWAGRLSMMTMLIAHARRARVALIAHSPPLRPCLAIACGIRCLRDLELLVLGVAGDADYLHAVHQERRDVERVRVVMNITRERS